MYAEATSRRLMEIHTCRSPHDMGRGVSNVTAHSLVNAVARGVVAMAYVPNR